MSLPIIFIIAGKFIIPDAPFLASSVKKSVINSSLFAERFFNTLTSFLN